jgi:DNA-binding response OmpR family regulator
MDEHRVLVGGKPVDFTYKEFELLKMMAATPGRAYSRDELLQGIWGYDYFGGTRTVDVHVRRLRAKIESTRAYIETVHGVGYRFIS